ncbi:MAG: polymerase sigma factor SigW [Candidatus Adlerbacteria bacterium]|nr:polymerase sigma factor SigW [Candidatus Adlerbacteria bacterium]
MDYRAVPDEQLAAQLQAGDKEVFGTFVERYEAKLLRYGTKFLSRTEDIEDIVQEVFVSAYQNIQSFDTSQKFSPWLYRIAHNAYVNALKKNSRLPRVMFDFDTLLSHQAYEDPAAAERDRADMRVIVDKGLEQLAPKYREVVVLYYLEELDYKEIAEVLQVPTGTVGVRLRRAKEALQAAYDKLNITYGE